jgi:hypothetical protein
VVLLASDSVESLSELSETRVAVSVAGVVSPKVLVSKTIVGLAAVVARAGTPKPKTPEMAREMIAAIATGFPVSAGVRMITPLLDPTF